MSFRRRYAKRRRAREKEARQLQYAHELADALNPSPWEAFDKAIRDALTLPMPTFSTSYTCDDDAQIDGDDP